MSAPGIDENTAKEAEAVGAYAYFEFTADGTINVGLAATDPAKGKEGVVIGSGKYKLLNGDKVEFSSMGNEKNGSGLFGKGEKSVVAVKISGDDMTITGTDGTAKFVRVR